MKPYRIKCAAVLSLVLLQLIPFTALPVARAAEGTCETARTPRGAGDVADTACERTAPGHNEASPSLQQRLDALVDQLEEKRRQLHIAGLAIAVVKDGEVILARGLGLADVDRQIPATADTVFPIGSSTKSFTATLIAMLIDEGKIDLDGPVTQYIPYFELNLDTDDEGAQATIRDLLSHRTGFCRMGPLAASGVPREDMLRTAAKAEPLSPFRKRWHYNNVMYLAAGVAAGNAAGSDWDTLIAERIFQPLGMRASSTSLDDLPADTPIAVGYRWEQTQETYRPQPALPTESIAPAGAIKSTALDMAQWLRFLLARGEYDGRRLVSEQQLRETWTPQIEIDGGNSYGLGWVISDWNGQPLLAHGGNTSGFTTQMVLLPESSVGFVLLTNAFATPLQQMSVGMVCDAVFGEPAGAGGGPGADYEPYLGKYVPTHRDTVFTVLEQNGALAVDIPGQTTFELKPPDEEGKWHFVLSDQIAVSFDRDAAGTIALMKVHQAGMEFECIREGVVVPPEMDLDELDRYLGTYHSDKQNADVRVFIQNNRLAVGLPGDVVAELRPPDEQGLWAFRFNPASAMKFSEDSGGRAESMTYYENGSLMEELARVVAEGDAPLPTLDQILALRDTDRRKAAVDELGAFRLSGIVRLPNAGVDGTVEWVAAGLDSHRQEIDYGRFGRSTLVVSRDHGYVESSITPFVELTGVWLEEAQRNHPAVPFGDWRGLFDSIRVAGIAEVDGRRAYRLKLEYGEAPARMVYVDAETGDALKEERLALLPGGVGNLPVEMRYDDYREIQGLRVPFRITLTNDTTGRVVMEFDKIETGLDLHAGVFAVSPPGQG